MLQNVVGVEQLTNLYKITRDPRASRGWSVRVFDRNFVQDFMQPYGLVLDKAADGIFLSNCHPRIIPTRRAFFAIVLLLRGRKDDSKISAGFVILLGTPDKHAG